MTLNQEEPQDAFIVFVGENPPTPEDEETANAIFAEHYPDFDAIRANLPPNAMLATPVTDQTGIQIPGEEPTDG